MTYEEMQAYIAWHCCDRTIGQIKECLGITTQRVRDIYDTVFNRPVEDFPKPAPDFLRRNETPPTRAILPIERAVLRRHAAGQSVRQIGRRMNIPTREVYRIYARHGIPPDMKKGSLRDMVYKAVDGKRTTAEIARHIGKQYSAVRQSLTFLVRQNLVSASPGRNPAWGRRDNGMD